MTVGEHVRAARKAAGLRQIDLEELSGVSAVAISLIERDVNLPSLSTAELLADALEISIDELVGHKIQKKEKLMG